MTTRMGGGIGKGRGRRGKGEGGVKKEGGEETEKGREEGITKAEPCPGLSPPCQRVCGPVTRLGVFAPA